jgi:hypothetical protein
LARTRYDWSDMEAPGSGLKTLGRDETGLRL